MREPRKRPNKRRQREDDEAATDAGTDPSMDAENGPMAKGASMAGAWVVPVFAGSVRASDRHVVGWWVRVWPVARKSFKKAATRRGLGVNGTTLQRGARSTGTFLDLAAK